MSAALQEFIDAGKRVNQIIREVREAAGPNASDFLIEVVVMSIVSRDATLVATLARRQVYRECVRSLQRQEQEQHQ